MEDWTGHFELINPGEIVIDHRYQRDERPGLIATISANPAWEPFSVITCIKRSNGIFYAVDGQQRLAGVLGSSKAPKKVPVVWFAVASLEEEARIFSVINEARKALFPIEKHKSRVVSKDASALAIERAVEKAGYSIGAGGDHDSRTVSGISTLNAIYNDLGEDGLVQTLVVVREAWPDDRGATRTKILRGVAAVISDMGDDYSRSKLVSLLAKTSPGRIERKANEITLDIGGSKQSNVRRAIKVLVKV